MTPRQPRASRALVLGALWCAACGARSGLNVPDAEVDAAASPDASVDAGQDAGPPPVVCIEVPPDTTRVSASFSLPVSLAVVDVFFLLDATASMLDEIDTIRARLRSRVVPGIRELIPDAAFGVALVGEFPVEPHASGALLPYDLRQPITTDVFRVEAAMERLPSWGNRDEPEAQVEGLYQLATGEGLAPWILPASGCPGGGSGGACFRGEAFPVVLLITDAPMHNGPPDVPPVDRYAFDGPHDYDDAVRALRELGALVIGLGARDPGSMTPMRHLRAIARDTGAIDGRGDALAFDIGATGSGVGGGIVEAVQRLASGVPLDVDAIVEDRPGDEVDATTLVTAVRATSAQPADGVTRIEGDTFFGVVPGTEVTFELDIDVSALPPSPSTRRVPARILFRAFGRSRLGREDVIIVIGGEGGCEEAVL